MENDVYTLVEPGTVKIGKVNINNPKYWSQLKKGNLISWTKDGILLNEIVFGQLDQGQHILGRQGLYHGSFGYDPEMSLSLVVEQFTDALSISNYHNIVLQEREGLNISGERAIQFKISYDSGSNVNYTAWALFVRQHEKLITIFASAPSRYYFPKFEDSYLEILESVSLL